MRGAERCFWRAIGTGAERLTPSEDALLWSLRAAHWDWPFIERAIRARRADETKAKTTTA